MSKKIYKLYNSLEDNINKNDVKILKKAFPTSENMKNLKPNLFYPTNLIVKVSRPQKCRKTHF